MFARFGFGQLAANIKISPLQLLAITCAEVCDTPTRHPKGFRQVHRQGVVRQDVAKSAASTGMCSQRGPAGEEPLQSGDSHTEASKKRFGTFALLKSTQSTTFTIPTIQTSSTPIHQHNRLS